MTAEEELAGFVEKFAPPMQERIRACRAWMRARFPRAVELVYDNYNFFVIGYGPTERTSEAVFSLAAYRGGVNLVFAQRATELPDPAGLLRGTGKVVRNTRIEQASDLDRPEVSALVTAAEELAARPLSDGEGPRLVIKSVSARQRPRR
ncbi:conserved hypothetical protein [Nostocoides japonicum T1-X7]|uniref:Uncharacterized protein n=1 Tax=Nostocoides japonicum T1-X7 TaxID=1194083 RepID=A0A077LXE7_9MICO|nr:DUF1801 domain-containing protein [Tetrasphaera japonica]CCH76595.1 conserved hypothetical protein [Tetrasphaera japonica T1-X7]